MEGVDPRQAVAQNGQHLPRPDIAAQGSQRGKTVAPEQHRMPPPSREARRDRVDAGDQRPDQVPGEAGRDAGHVAQEHEGAVGVRR